MSKSFQANKILMILQQYREGLKNKPNLSNQKPVRKYAIGLQRLDDEESDAALLQWHCRFINKKKPRLSNHKGPDKKFIAGGHSGNQTQDSYPGVARYTD